MVVARRCALMRVPGLTALASLSYSSQCATFGLPDGMMCWTMMCTASDICCSLQWLEAIRQHGTGRRVSISGGRGGWRGYREVVECSAWRASRVVVMMVCLG